MARAAAALVVLFAATPPWAAALGADGLQGLAMEPSESGPTPLSSEHGNCELCMFAVDQVQYGQIPSCGGDTKNVPYSACSQIVQSMLGMAHDVMHLIAYGCYKYSPYHGWQTVKPCPAHVICGRLQNLYDAEHKAMCPTDFHYRFPHAYRLQLRGAGNPLKEFADKLAQVGGVPVQPAPGTTASTELPGSGSVASPSDTLAAAPGAIDADRVRQDIAALLPAALQRLTAGAQEQQ